MHFTWQPLPWAVLANMEANTTPKDFTVFYSHQGQLVCNHLLYVRRTLLHHSVAFTRLKLSRLTFWRDKSFTCALLHTHKKNLDTKLFPQMPASATRWMVCFVRLLSDCLMLAHVFQIVQPPLSIHTVFIFQERILNGHLNLLYDTVNIMYFYLKYVSRHWQITVKTSVP